MEFVSESSCLAEEKKKKKNDLEKILLAAEFTKEIPALPKIFSKQEFQKKSSFSSVSNH